MRAMRTHLASIAIAALLGGCDGWTDPATRLASDMESAVGRLDRADGARTTLVHREPSKPGECEGPYRVQLNATGAMIVWCFDDAGRTTASGSTSYHNNFTGTDEDFLVDKPAGEPLRVTWERRGGRPMIVSVS